MRVAIYARYSSDQQNPRSCDDQVALCQAHADRRGWQVVAAFRDEAISGFATANRPGLNTAIAAANARAFDLLLTEDESRISRNLGHLATLRDELAMAGVRIATLSTDNVELMHVAFKGAFAQQYLIDLGQKTARGMSANAEKGLATGAKLYGYVTAPGGAISIDEGEAEIVRRIHRLYADERLSAREVADRLNRDRVPGPRGGFWNASTIAGEKKRGNGVLRSEIYAGVKIYGRDEVRKDPRTGRRTHHYKPPEQWRRVPVEHLRIVPADLWARTQDRLEEAGHDTSQRRAAHRKGLLSGLIKCGCCGASYTSYSKSRLVCAARRERGPSVCSNEKMVLRAEVEARALEGIRTRMLSPASVRLYVRAYHEAAQRVAGEQQARRRPLEKRLAELTRQVGRLVDRICDGTDTPETNARLKTLEAEKAAVAAELAAEPPPAVVEPFHGAAEAYVKIVRDLEATLAEAGAEADRKLIDSVRDLILKIEIIPDTSAPAGVRLRLHGNLSLLLKPDPRSDTPSQRMAVGCRVVAGGGIGLTPTDVPAVFDMPLHKRAA